MDDIVIRITSTHIKRLIVTIVIFILVILCWLYLKHTRSFVDIPPVSTGAHIIANAMNEYRTKYGKYPEGGNANIIKALKADGKSYKHFEAIRTNQNGEALDPWRTPYGIFTAPHGIIFRSAGKNKIMEDDLLLKGYGDDHYIFQPYSKR